MLPPREPSQIRSLQRLKVKGWKKIFHANGKQKENWGSSTYI